MDITITTTNGTSATSSSDQFTYTATPPPSITAISPTAGSPAGGDTVTIVGTNLTGATTVGFGATSSISMTVNSDTQITVTSPPGTGTVDVTVTTPAGTSPTTAADRFTYVVAVPQVTAINPSTGAGAGGDIVSIVGSGFNGATAVAFGGNQATAFTVDSDTQITATTPGGLNTVDVTVTTSAGTSPTGAADRFTYVTAGLPSVLHVVPNTGASAGGDSVTVTGLGFTGATDVSFGGISAGSFFSVDSDVQITVTTPPGTGTVDITVTVPAGTSATSSSDLFTYF